jgi:hypothetical protein
MVQGWLLKRQEFSHVRLLRELSDEAEDWRNYLRMDVETYNHLLNLVKPRIEKKNLYEKSDFTT